MITLSIMHMVENWAEILSNPPYNIVIKEDGDYVLLKYNQLNSDFNLPIVREAAALFLDEMERV